LSPTESDRLAQRIDRIGLSPTLRISALAAEMRAAGEDVLDFSAGQPDFDTPEIVKEAGIAAIRANRTRYTPNPGAPELRRAIAETLAGERGLDYSTDQILVSPGAKASLYFATMALLDPGDEVLVPTPYWVSYPEQIRLAEAVPVFVACDEDRGFKLDAEALEAAITPKTKALILNYPSNPTGACYRLEELQPLAEVCVRHRLWVIADEIYSRLLFDDRRFVSVAQLGPEIRKRTLVIDGMSKTYSMTGWRIGYAAGPSGLIHAMSKVQSHCTSNATSISQWASIEALRLPAEEIILRAAEFQRRRDRIVGRLRAIPGVHCVQPEGSFYAFPNVSGCSDRLARLAPESDLAEYLLQEARVAVVPGAAFGSEDHIRISYAVSLEEIDEGMSRIEEALGRAAP
jgi:aspartate aminotransferase